MLGDRCFGFMESRWQSLNDRTETPPGIQHDFSVCFLLSIRLPICFNWLLSVLDVWLSRKMQNLFAESGPTIAINPACNILLQHHEICFCCCCQLVENWIVILLAFCRSGTNPLVWLFFYFCKSFTDFGRVTDALNKSFQYKELCWYRGTVKNQFC